MATFTALGRGVGSARLSGITNASPGVIFNIPKDAMIRAWPTAAGTATAYSTGSNAALAQIDANIGSSAITATGNGPAFGTNAGWSAWGAGAVVADTVQMATMHQSAVALVPASGTWVLEVACNAAGQ